MNKEFIRKFVEKVMEPVKGYTRVVLFTKNFLLIIACILILTVVLIPVFNPVHEQFDITYTDVEEDEDGGKTKMIRPRFQGMDSKGQPFKVLADYAVQEEDKEINLYNLNAEMTSNDNSWFGAVADNGYLKSADKELDLKGSVNLFTDSGYEFKTDSAHINMGTHYAISEDPVNGFGPIGKIEASGFETKDEGNSIVFKGRVKVTILPNKVK